MATLDWPTAAGFTPSEFKISVSTPKTAFAATYTGQVQSISQLADRLRITMMLPPCKEPAAGQREAFFQGLASAGDWVRLWHMARPYPKGTLRGTPTAGAAAIAGAKTLTVQTTAGATMLAGDVLGAPSQLVMCAYPGATANGSGVMSLPLALPLRKAISNGATLTWNQPIGTFQILSVQPEVSYLPGGIQAGLELSFSEVYT